MPRTRLFRSALLLSIAAMAGTAAAEARCWRPHEVSAAQVRYFQTMMMVGALKCRSDDRFVKGDYNDFVDRSRDVLDENNNILHDRFLLAFGRVEGEERYDSFTTRLANDFSSQSGSAAFCDDAAALLRVSVASHPGDIVALSEAIVDELPLRDPVCSGAEYRQEARYERPEYRYGAEEAYMAAATAPMDAEAALAAEEAAAAAEEAPPPERVAEPARSPGDEAMQAALKALDAAAAALRAASAAGGASAQPQEAEVTVVDGVPTDRRPLIGAPN